LKNLSVCQLSQSSILYALEGEGMETVYWDEEKKRPIVPIIPFYCSEGNTIVSSWEEEFVDRNNNKATLGVLTFKNKKGKISEPVVYRVKFHTK
jgi:hypothetical protein